MKRETTPRAHHDADDAPGKRLILAAALQLFTSKGIEGTSVRDIAEATGLTNPALFRHFAGKEALAAHLFERIFSHLRASLPVIDESAFSDQLRATLAAYLQYFDDDLESALFFQENLRRFWPQLPAALRRQSLIAHLRALLAVGSAQAVIDAEEDPQLLMVVISGLLGQFARQLYFKEIAGSASSHLDAIHRLALRCVAASPSLKRKTSR